MNIGEANFPWLRLGFDVAKNFTSCVVLSSSGSTPYPGPLGHQHSWNTGTLHGSKIFQKQNSPPQYRVRTRLIPKPAQAFLLYSTVLFAACLLRLHACFVSFSSAKHKQNRSHPVPGAGQKRRKQIPAHLLPGVASAAVAPGT